MAPRNFHEFIAAARKEPARFNIGVPGATGAVTVEMLKSITGIGLTAVPYKGSAPAEIAVISGEIDVLFVSVTNALPHVQAGRVRGFGISTAARVPPLPEVPTFEELGMRDFRVGVWHGLFMPARSSLALVKRLHDELARMFENRDLRKQFTDTGTEIIVNTPDEFAAKLKSEIERFRRIMTAAGVQPQ
jgi:tripartite-type tricarboxylate transporter receptor subunit TctC